MSLEACLDFQHGGQRIPSAVIVSHVAAQLVWPKPGHSEAVALELQKGLFIVQPLMT